MRGVKMQNVWVGFADALGVHTESVRILSIIGCLFPARGELTKFLVDQLHYVGQKILRL